MYDYCLGLRRSRRIARALEEDVGFRVGGGHIAHALEASIDVLGRIFRTREILALRDPVYEQYASEIEASSGKNGEETT